MGASDTPERAGSSDPSGVPGWCADVDRATRALLHAAARAEAWEGPARQEMLVWAARHRDVLAVLEGRVLTAERDAGTWALRGDRDLAGFVGRTSRGGRGAGTAAVGQADTLAAMPTVAEALVDGRLTSAHVAQITRATRQSSVLAAELASADGQERVVEMARRLDGGEFGKALAGLSASVDPATRQRQHDEQRAARSLAWTHTPGGTLLSGRLDSVAGRRLAKVIDALCPRPAVDDDRSRLQRQADALMVLVERAETDPGTTPGAVAPVQGIVTFTQEAWAALRAARRPAEAGAATVPGGATVSGGETVRGAAIEVVDRLRGVDPVTDETGQAWPASEIARALCDCSLTWAMVGTPAAELNLGRQSRVFRRQHWLALHAAGVTGCSIAGCGMPLAYCELHHLAWWSRDGGGTDLANCAAYCSFHHHEVHRLGIVATRRPDGALVHHHPDGRPYGGAPPGAPVDPAAGAPEGLSAGVLKVPPAGGSVSPSCAPSSCADLVGDPPTPARSPHSGRAGEEPPPHDLLELLTG